MLIYIAGPYRSDPVANTRHAIDEWEVLRDAGYTAIVPHASLILDLCYPQTPEFWLDYDLVILEKCDLLLRLPGFSKGADDEVTFCEAHDIPVFRGTAEQFIKLDIDLADIELGRAAVKRIERGEGW